MAPFPVVRVQDVPIGHEFEYITWGVGALGRAARIGDVLSGGGQIQEAGTDVVAPSLECVIERPCRMGHGLNRLDNFVEMDMVVRADEELSEQRRPDEPTVR